MAVIRRAPGRVTARAENCADGGGQGIERAEQVGPRLRALRHGGRCQHKACDRHRPTVHITLRCLMASECQ